MKLYSVMGPPIAATFAAALALLPDVAEAKCRQQTGCDAVVAISARFEAAPQCITVDAVELEDGCNCEGYLHVANDCDFDIEAVDFEWHGELTVLRSKSTEAYEVRDRGNPPGEYRSELALTAEGQPFAMVVDYTTEFAHDPAAASCSASVGTRPGMVGFALLVFGLVVVGRRGRSNA